MPDDIEPAVGEDPIYPVWICSPCGAAWGRRPARSATFHPGVCGLCGAHRAVTEPRDFGHLRLGWQAAIVNPPEGASP